MLRFSRRLIADTIAARIEAIEKSSPVPFSRGNGWAQVKGRGEDVNRSYGAWDVLNSVMEDLGLWKEIEESDNETT